MAKGQHSDVRGTRKVVRQYEKRVSKETKLAERRAARGQREERPDAPQKSTQAPKREP